MADQTLQSFLVKLGFIVDPAGQKRFQDSLTGAARQVNELRLGLVALAIGVEETVRRTTRAFDQLFYASSSLNESAQNINKLRDEFAAATGDAGKADQALAAFDKNIRERGRAQADAIARQEHFTWTTHVEFLEGIGKAYYDAVKKSGSEFSAEALRIRAEVNAMGIDFDGLLRDYSKNFDLAQENAAKMSKIYAALGLDTKNAWEDYSKRARDIDIMFTDLGKTFQTAFGVILLNPDISKAISDIAEGLGHWLVKKETQEAIAGILDSIDKGLKDPETIKEIGTALHDLGEIVLAVARAVGWLIETIGVKGLAEIFGGYVAVTVLGSIAGAITAIATALGLLVAGPAVAGWAVLAAIFAGFTLFKQGTGQPGSPTDPEHPQFTDPSIPAMPLPDAPGGQPATVPPAAAPGRTISPETNRPASEHGRPDRAAGKGPALDLPHMQLGGIVPAALHPGEMVLPRQISEGLQQLFMRPAYAGFANDNQLADQIDRWLSGDTSFKPIVDLASQSFEKLRDLFLDFFPEITQVQAPGGAGAGAGGAGGGGAGGDGAGGGGPLQLQPGGPALRGNVAQRARDMYQYLTTQMKVDPAHAQAMLANFMAESSLNPTELGDRGTSFGLEQMHNERWTRMKAALGERINDPYAQLQYALQEPGELGRIKQFLAAGGSPQQLTDLWQNLIERPADQRPGKRYGQLSQIQGAVSGGGALANVASWQDAFDKPAASWQMDFGERRGGAGKGDLAYNDSSTTTVVVNGVTDPHGSGRAVTDRLDRRSAQHMRNFRTNVA